MVKKEKIAKVVGEKAIAAENVDRAVNIALHSPEKTYASFFKNPMSQQNPPQTKSSVIDDFLKLATFFLEREELTLEQKINIFLDDFKNIPKSEFLRLLNKVGSQYEP